MQKTVLAALAAMTLGAVPVQAADGKSMGTFRPAWSLNFTGGVTDKHNSIGLTLGGHVPLARFGNLRFPTVGADVGAAYVCDPDGRDLVQGLHDPCAGRGMAGLVQLTGGAELVLGRERVYDNSGREHTAEETSLVLAATHVVAGPFRGSWGLNIGIAKRW